MSDEPLRLTAGDAVLGRLESILNGGRESIRQRVAEIVDEAQRQARLDALLWARTLTQSRRTDIGYAVIHMEPLDVEIARLTSASGTAGADGEGK